MRPILSQLLVLFLFLLMSEVGSKRLLKIQEQPPKLLQHLIMFYSLLWLLTYFRPLRPPNFAGLIFFFTSFGFTSSFASILSRSEDIRASFNDIVFYLTNKPTLEMLRYRYLSCPESIYTP